MLNYPASNIPAELHQAPHGNNGHIADTESARAAELKYKCDLVGYTAKWTITDSHTIRVYVKREGRRGKVWDGPYIMSMKDIEAH